MSHADAIVSDVSKAVQKLSSTDTIILDDEQLSKTAYRRSFAFDLSGRTLGYLSVSFDGRESVSFTGRVAWDCLPAVEVLPETLDSLWADLPWRYMYAYDQDDYNLQNLTVAVGMEQWGLREDQVDMVTHFGWVKAIDTRNNPGAMLHIHGLLVSVQWLSYWSGEAVDRIMSGPIISLPSGVLRTDFVGGGVRIRLGPQPGRFDDVAFHLLQLECRSQLPFAYEP